MSERRKFGVISLGCDKNRVDTEKMIAVLKEKYDLTTDEEDADIIVINTCAFLESSRREAIEEILRCYGLKKDGKLKKLVVTGCLPQKFIGELFPNLTEADVFAGVSDYEVLADKIEESFTLNERINAVGTVKNESLLGREKTTKSYSYLKISDGCSNCCTYCLIPKIRGQYRSYPIDSLIKEAESLESINELILVAQDLTKYGEDKKEYGNLVSLLRKLSALPNVKNIRLLYCYPEGINDELIDEIANNGKIIKYIDIPFQHASDRILKLMNRKGSKEFYLSLISKLREKIAGLTLRSTFIAGFPTENEEDISILKSFLTEAKLDSVGFFAYSKEEGTIAATMNGQIKKSVKEKRVKELYRLQSEISTEKFSSLIGKVIDVYLESFDGVCYEGRRIEDAPEVDSKVIFTGLTEAQVGDVVKVKILSYKDFEFYGEVQ